MSAQRSIRKGLIDTLVADGTVNGFVSGRVRSEIAPTGTAYPYIVLSLSSGVSTNDSPREPKDYEYMVKCISPSQSVAAQVASAIYDALQDASPDLDSPWKLLRMNHLSDFEYVENLERDKLYHSGGLYRIRVNK